MECCETLKNQQKNENKPCLKNLPSNHISDDSGSPKIGFQYLIRHYLKKIKSISEEQVCEVEIQIQNEEKCEIVEDQECDTVNERQCSVTEVEQCQEQLQLITEELCEDIIETTCTQNNECSVRFVIISDFG